MSGTAAKMTAENLCELLGLFADYLLQWRWGGKTNGARRREVGREGDGGDTGGREGDGGGETERGTV